MTRDEVFNLLNDLDGLVFTVGGFRIRVQDMEWLWEDKWFAFDLRLLPSGPANQNLPQNPDWNAIATALGLDGLNLTSKGGQRISDVEARLWASFS